MNIYIKTVVTLVTVLFSFFSLNISAQSVKDLIRKNPSYASCNYHLYPDSINTVYTPAPEGKRPFYISHYGRHGSRYINSRRGYENPYMMIEHADSLNELTPTGEYVLRETRKIMRDTENRWGELSGSGKRQMEDIGRRMVENFPEVLHPGAHVTAISTTVPRCIESMGTFTMKMLQVCPQLDISIQASRRTQWYMNYQDKQLRNNYMTKEAKKAYDAYVAPRLVNSRLMELIFKNPDIVKEFVDEEFFNYYLMKMALFQQNISYNHNPHLIKLFTNDEFYRMWQVDNALWYIQHGACKLNGGKQPYSQRYLLRQLIVDADSCINLEQPGAQLRFGHETVLLPLVCLLGINGYDLATDDLDDLEAKGWWCSSVFPMGSNLQFIFYRSNPQDKDVLVKVLLNEIEAKLPIKTDCAPYYHWRDVRKYCIKKLAAYKK